MERIGLPEGNKYLLAMIEEDLVEIAFELSLEGCVKFLQRFRETAFQKEATVGAKA